MKCQGILLSVFLLWAAPLGAGESSKPADVKLAALALPTGAQSDWRQWDSFLTNVVKKVGQEIPPNLREQLGEAFLDSRYQLSESLKAGNSDPVPQLFQSAWSSLAPIIKQAIPSSGQQTATQYRSFITAMDAASSLGNSLQSFGLFRLTPDTLRGAAKLLNAGNGDPLVYTAQVDSILRGLLGFTEDLPAVRPNAQIEQSRWQRLRDKASAAVRSVLIRSAYAAEPDFDRLNQWVPDNPEVQDYLVEVRQLLAETSDAVIAKSHLAAEQQQLFRQIVYATAWQESCWRQFTKKGEKLTPIASATGDVGLMQVNKITWRSLYDDKGLSGDMMYNGHAGVEILHYYLTRFAIPKKEDKQPSGNLARATYSAYNAGPGGLARYRGVRQSAVWKKVDEAFWTKFEAVSSGHELAVKTCYGQ